ncbi:MAG: hypothetical protein K8R74_07375, partial [Bacteroidales bacterium]|nr:hypothetical protein [Bacteroidales bacterium]
HEMIENTKAKFRDNGFFYLLWGWLVLIASVSHFIMMNMGIEYAWLPWPVMMFGGGIASGIVGYRLGKKASVKTFFDTAIVSLWYAFTITLFIILVASGVGRISWDTANVLIIALYGLGTFISGSMMKFKPLVYGGIFSWVVAIVGLFLSSYYSLPLVAISIIVAYLIPGYMLKSRAKTNGYV